MAYMTASIEVGRRTFAVPDKVFLDTNFIIAVRIPTERYHKAATVMFKKLLAAASVGSVALYTSTMVLNEVWFILAKILYEDGDRSGSWSDKLTRKRAFQQYRNELAEVTGLLSNNDVITIADVTSHDVPKALNAVTDQSHNFEPCDAFHVAVISRLSIQAIATGDRDFQDLPSLLALPFDIPDRQVDIS